MAFVLSRLHRLVCMFFLSTVFDLALFVQRNHTYFKGLQVYLTLHDGK